ncbi:MAG: ATP-dependent RecD-like DNA helicase [Defluviitaleaceae bacterium]|nr:ATP-dependent RecD-like DNA helicase [Defluviitaleaceae bacterium]
MAYNDEEEELSVAEGSVRSIIFQNADNGYTVFSVSSGNGDEEDRVVCVGNVPFISVGEEVVVRGKFVNHHTHGRQMNVASCEKSVPTTAGGLERYLGAGNIKGVGAKRAKLIVSAFGEDTLDVLENHPDKLAKIKGISKKQAADISEQFNKQNKSLHVYMQLLDMGITYGAAKKLYERYKEDTIESIRRNPYKLADEVYGIGFKLADSIAYKLGFESDSPARIESGIRYVLSQAAVHGHVYLPLDELVAGSCNLLGLPVVLTEERLSAMQIAMMIRQDVAHGVSVVYLNKYYSAEAMVAKKLMDLVHSDVRELGNVEREMALFEVESGVRLADAQKLAVREVLENGVCVITGGPGTGKTTTIRTVIAMLAKLGLQVELAAPTGRAAKRMTEATGMEAKTIHRLLEITFNTGAGTQHFGRTQDKPLECDVLIVDEASMIDVLLMSWLVNAVAHGTKLVLVGDVDQLPPIGPGNVLKDVIRSGCIKVVRLREIFRQAQESAIVMNAHRINSGVYPVLNESGKDFFFMERAAIGGVCATIGELMAQRLPKYLATRDAQDIQVLTPMRKGPLGANELNKQLQAILNPPAPGKDQQELSSNTFRVGDKVMQTKNNYNMPWHSTHADEEGTGIFNGDMGIVESINITGESITVVFDGERAVEYAFAQTDELSLAYATTVHKAQGSEYRAVILPIHSGAPVLLTRNLLYTALTRAKELVVVVGLRETLNRMVDNTQEAARYTSLDIRLTKMQMR